MSDIQDAVGTELKRLFPHVKVEPQYYVKYLGFHLFFDFCIPSFKVLIEVQGEQHYRHIPFFHTGSWEFSLAKKRDRLKREWAALEGWQLIEIPYTDFPLSPVYLLGRIKNG
jgi:very-short-patch-repair endonuclease